MAKEAVVYPGGGSGVCVAHGGCAGTLRGALRSEEASRLLRGDTLPDGGREAHALAPKKPGRLQRYDYEYERKGTANIFAFFEPKRRWRDLDVTERRTAVDFALAMRRLVDEHYPAAEKVRVGLDNLNTHTPASLYKAFEPEEARRILGRLEFDHTPKHASWLNMVEIELSRCFRGSGWRVASPMLRGLPGRSGPLGTGAQRRRGDGTMALHGFGRSGEAGTPLPGTTVVVEY